jgi:hypothetical protein
MISVEHARHRSGETVYSGHYSTLCNNCRNEVQILHFPLAELPGTGFRVPLDLESAALDLPLQLSVAKEQ